MAAEHHDVIVLGAGMAGLRCAHELVHAKGVRDVLVVDAMDRVGGRILSDSEFIPGMTIEVGAEFAHGANTSLTKLAAEQHWALREIFTWAQADGGPTDPAPDGGIGYYYLGDQKRMLAYDDPDEEFQHFNECVSKLSETEDVDAIPPTKSMRDYFEGDCELSPSMMQLADAGYGNTAGGPIGDISMRITCRYEKQWIELEDEGDFRVVPTFKRIIDHFHNGVTTKLGWPVASIDHSDPERIVLTSKSGETLSCRKLVVTVAIAVFNDIKYTPSLPENKLDAVASYGMLRAGKVLLHMTDAFWPANTHGVICTGCFLPEFWVNSTRGVGFVVENGDELIASASSTSDGEVQYLVTGFAGPETAEKLTAIEEKEIIARFLAQLDTIYGTSDHPTPASDCFVKGMYLDWGDIEYVRGGYSYPRVGQRDDAARDLAAPVEDRIFFAGEATAFEQPSMSVHAAMDTGLRAAGQVARALLI